MLKIRLQRVGRKNEPVFRIVLTDSQNGPKSGKFLEILGSYDSRRGEKAEISEANATKIKHHLSKGALASETIHNILVRKNIIDKKIIDVLPKSVIAGAKTKIIEAKQKAEEEKLAAIEAKKAEEAKAKEEAEAAKEEAKAEAEKPIEVVEEAPVVTDSAEEATPVKEEVSA